MGVFSDGHGLYNGAPPNKENYRSIGRGNGGVATSTKKKGGDSSWRDSEFYQTMPSIPGKFETVLYKGNREEKGFGSRATRFGQEPRSAEAPGPGAHGNSTTLKGNSDVVGKRGQGPFASRTPRQKDPKTEAPGPGFYHAPIGLLPPASQRSSTAPNAVFVPPSSVNPATFNKRVSPGPCDYPGWTKPNISSAGACLSHAPVREDATLAHPVPGPGSYELRDKPVADDVAHSRSGARLSSARRRGQTPREQRALPEAALMRKSAEVLAEDVPPAKAVPGPGHYNPKPEVVAGGGQTSFSTGESVSFRVGNSHMPRRWRGEGGPGPGAYEAPASPSRGVAAAAAFASLSHRFPDQEAEAPGPAFYSPRKLPDCDFHLNTPQMWM